MKTAASLFRMEYYAARLFQKCNVELDDED